MYRDIFVDPAWRRSSPVTVAGAAGNNLEVGRIPRAECLPKRNVNKRNRGRRLAGAVAKVGGGPTLQVYERRAVELFGR